MTPVSKEDLIEIANLRVLLECSALEVSLRTGDADWEGNLVAAHHKLHLIEKRCLPAAHRKRNPGNAMTGNSTSR